MSKKDSTRTRARAQQKKQGNSPTLSQARTTLAVAPSEQHKNLSRLLVGIYKNKSTPDFIRHAVFQLFWDLSQHYKISLPKDFTAKWLSYWPLLLARVSRDGYVPASIRYSWHPTPEEETRLDAEEKEETDARAIFDLINNDQLQGEEIERIRESVTSIIDKAHPCNRFEVFTIAWPLALETLEQEKASDQ